MVIFDRHLVPHHARRSRRQCPHHEARSRCVESWQPKFPGGRIFHPILDVRQHPADGPISAPVRVEFEAPGERAHRLESAEVGRAETSQLFHFPGQDDPVHHDFSLQLFGAGRGITQGRAKVVKQKFVLAKLAQTASDPSKNADKGQGVFPQIEE